MWFETTRLTSDDYPGITAHHVEGDGPHRVLVSFGQLEAEWLPPEKTSRCTGGTS